MCVTIEQLLWWLCIGVAVFHVASSPDLNRFRTHTTAARKFWLNAASPNGLLRSIPALTKKGTHDSTRKTIEVAGVRTKRKSNNKRKKNRQLPKLPQLQLPPLPDLNLPDLSSTGLYYGLTPKTLASSIHPDKKKKRPGVQDTVLETLEELRSMRKEMEALRREMSAMKRQMSGQEPEEEQTTEAELGVAALMARRKRQNKFEKIAKDVEQWAERLLFEQDGPVDGWTEVQPNKVLCSTFNKDGRTRAYLQWMKDSRGKYAAPDDNREYPCLKVYSTVDAPLEDVCYFLSSEEHAREYNSFLVRHKDVEEITPHSKICAMWTPQILFIKPRLLTTFCSHRWLRDDTQVVVNQACNHVDVEKEDLPRAYALRGANFISRDPDDPSKTRIAMITHCHPGADVPQWATKTAVNTMAPIEPFKLFYNINQGVQTIRPERERCMEEMELVSMPPGRSVRPAGLAQMGYACFWPQGGGLQEGLLHSHHTGDHASQGLPPSEPTESSTTIQDEPAPSNPEPSLATVAE